MSEPADGSSGAIFQHPLAYLVGVEGVALLRAFAGEHDEAFTWARFAELQALLSDPGRWGGGVAVQPLPASDVYNSWAFSYDGPNPIFDIEEPVVRPILDGLAPGSAIDAACGTGRYSRYLADRGHHVLGLDQSPGMLAVARESLPDALFACADVHHLPVSDRSVDLVVSALAFAHIEHLDPVFAETARVLRRGGHFVVSDSRTQFLGSVLYPWLRRTTDGRVGYLPTWRHDVGEYVRSALAHDFEILTCQEPLRPERDLNPSSELPEPGEPTDIWELMPLVADAARAAYAGRPALVVWDFRLR